MSIRTVAVSTILSVLALVTTSDAQQSPPAAAPTQQAIAPYGQPLDLETARRVVAGAEAEATKSGWPVAISVVDSTGHLVLFEKLDNTQYGSIEVATQKAVTAINYRRPGKAFQDAVAGGGVGLRVLTLPGISAYEGGYPLIVDGKLVGAVGVSGVLPPQDDQVARAGVEALKAR
ncbi:GlcG/HbpS family heme-binding protein [Methylobacterium longum]|uniref:Heme-binding protein n=1 Tax=Methylobacterium longum TaxID=767694 RepID=A0ABT8AKH3_9HYPH|nr:heme-binding protein [Methylobacterium longum]MDN3570258.1 heme-binding protein [Methylobacterium longum]